MNDAPEPSPDRAAQHDLQGRPPGTLSGWDLFVLRHQKAENLALHFVSAVLFFGSPIYGLVTGDARWLVFFCLAGCIGTVSHYLFRDGTVSVRQASSSPRVVAYNVRMWWRVLSSRYRGDLALARARLARAQAELGRTALVTGAASGSGCATVEALLERGWTVIAAMRRPADFSLSREAREKFGDRLTVFPADITDPRMRAALLAHVMAKPRLDALVSAAGLGVFGAVEDLTETDLRQQMEASFFASALLLRALIPRLRAHDGVLVQLSSPAGVTALPWTGAYCASTHAIEGLIESLYHELAASGEAGGRVRVHLVTPSPHRTAFFARSRWIVASGGLHERYVLGYRAVMSRAQARPLPPAREIGEAVAELVERRGAPFRVDIGRKVPVLRTLVRWLPAFLRDRLMTFLFRGSAVDPFRPGAHGREKC